MKRCLMDVSDATLMLRANMGKVLEAQNKPELASLTEIVLWRDSHQASQGAPLFPAVQMLEF